MKLPFLPKTTESPDDKACRIRRWAHAWAESFRHEAKQKTSADSLAATETNLLIETELPEDISASSMVSE